MARKKMTERERFGRAVERFFASIRRVLPVLEEYETDELDFYGHRKKAVRPVTNELGEAVERVEWIVPPTVSGLCLHLGVDKDTFFGYLKCPDYAGATLRALLRIENALNMRMIEEPKAARGIIRDLAHNFGWSEHREVDFSAAAREAMTGAALTMAEKRALLLAAAGELESARNDD